jgi:hypothetical protein
MDKKWAEANNAVAPTPAAATSPSFASLNANGTGAFIVESHQPGVKTVFKANPNWWRKPEHNLKEIIFTPIGSDATRVAALLSGEVDIIEPVPIQDISRVDSSPNAQVLKGPEIRTIFLGMDQVRDELLYSNIKGKNPVQGRPRPRSLLQGDRYRTDQDPRDARPFDAVGADDRAAAVRAFKGFHAAEIRSRRRQEAADRSRLSRRLRSHDGLPQRPLRQRRRDLPGGGRHAGPHRRQGQPAGAAQGAVFRQGAEARRLPDLVLPAGLDARHARLAQRALRHHGLPRRSEIRAARPISAATATRRWTNSPTRCCRKPIRPSAIC